MATVTILERETRATFTGEQRDSVTVRYQIEYGTKTADPTAVLIAGQSAIGLRLPLQREQYAPGIEMYAQRFEMSAAQENPTVWYCDVTWQSPPIGQLGNFSLHPTLRPPKVRIDYMEKEVPVEEAFNLDAFTGTGFTRAENTLGPITNSALQETVDPIMETEWDGVIVITRWVSSLNTVLALNNNYKRTTNNGLVLGIFPARTLKYQVTMSSEEQEQNSMRFYEIQTHIGIHKTTDRYVNNVGWKQVVSGELENIKDKDGNDIAEPKFLTLAGEESDAPVTVGYRYLDPVNYAPLVS